jgi:hypothetical protein
MPSPTHLQLSRVVFYGRALAEYERFFDLNLGQLKGRTVLDCPSGASSFCAEAARQGIRVVAVDPFFSTPADQLRAIGEADIDHVMAEVARTPNHYAAGQASHPELRSARRRSLHLLCDDFASPAASGRYVSALLPHLPFADGQFDLVLSGHFLFIYDDRFDYDFHLAAIRELARVSSGEVRVFPPRGMNRAPYPHLDRLRRELARHGIDSDVRRVDFEAVTGWNELLVLHPDSRIGRPARNSATEQRVSSPD